MNIRCIAPVCVLLAGLCMTNAALAQNGSQNKKERQAQTQPSAKLKVGSNAPAFEWSVNEQILQVGDIPYIRATLVVVATDTPTLRP